MKKTDMGAVYTKVKLTNDLVEILILNARLG